MLISPTGSFQVGSQELPRVLHADAMEGIQTLSDESVDLVISSPPYNIGKIYERRHKLSFDEYIKWQDEVIGCIVPKIKSSGSLCWQTGNYVKDGSLIPLDIPLFSSFASRGMRLKNRIIWRFNFGFNSRTRFSGRYETVLWFTKNDTYKFNLDMVRVPQLYPGKRHSKQKGALAGKPSGNPKGKNPSDYWEFSASEHFDINPVWDIPNLRSGHPEKTDHPCQFPIELAERCVLALTSPGDFVLDPFVGTGASLIAAMKHGRTGLGIEKDGGFASLACDRLNALTRGDLKMRPSGRPIRHPLASEKVSRMPDEWLETRVISPRADDNGADKKEAQG